MRLWTAGFARLRSSPGTISSLGYRLRDLLIGMEWEMERLGVFPGGSGAPAVKQQKAFQDFSGARFGKRDFKSRCLKRTLNFQSGKLEFSVSGI